MIKKWWLAVKARNELRKIKQDHNSNGCGEENLKLIPVDGTINCICTLCGRVSYDYKQWIKG
jgi:hypothetical protein